MKRGEIYYIGNSRTTYESGSEQFAGRPAIIVSNDKCNEFSTVIEVVYLTTQEKNPLPTHIGIRSTGTQSIALCEAIYSVSTDRVLDHIGKCTEYEMQMVDVGLAISLGLDFPETVKVSEPVAEQTEPVNVPDPDATVVAELNREIEEHKAVANDFHEKAIRLEAERDTFKLLYEALLERIVKANG